MSDQQVLTPGQEAMSVTFNPGQREDVASLKQIFADCYDEIDKWGIPKLRGVEEEITDCLELATKMKLVERKSKIVRLAAIAKTNLETAQMYAVKAVTR